MRTCSKLPAFLLCCVALSACSGTMENSPGGQAWAGAGRADNPWAQRGRESVEEKLSRRGSEPGTARNVILFVGDGMGISTVTAARILEGQRRGGPGEDNELSFDRFPWSGLSRTYNVDAQTPDSAGTMTAMITGVKTDAGLIGVDADALRGDCASTAGNELVSALELAELAGMATGIVSTARLTHATPAATYAKSPERNWEDDSQLPEAAVEAGCEDVASQLIDFEQRLERRFPGAESDGIEVAMGGGRRHFLPAEGSQPAEGSPLAEGSPNEGEGRRGDGRDLIAEWRSRHPDGHYINDAEGLEALAGGGPVLGLFASSHMSYEAERRDGHTGEPSLPEMTLAAIKRLEDNPRGFFLMVEAGRIDHAHHAGNAFNALSDTIELSDAVQAAVDATDDSETLIIVTADHSHVFTIGGYPRRGNPILGKVVNVGEEAPALAEDGRPYTTLGYYTGRGFHDLGDEHDADAVYEEDVHHGRGHLAEIDTTAPGYHQEALVPLEAETHGGEDVGIYARGPGAWLVSGSNEQNVIFHIMDYAADLTQKARARLEAGGG